MFFVFMLLTVTAGAGAWNEQDFGGKVILLNQKVQPLPTLQPGPFVKLVDGSVLTIDKADAKISRDDGRTWSELSRLPQPDKYQPLSEGALLRTREGVLVFAFLNAREFSFRWDQAKGGPLPDCRSPVYITRSEDDGETWEVPRLIQDGYCGTLRTMIQLRSGRLVLGSQKAVADPGRHVCFTLVSDDRGKTWKQSSIIDLGEYGGYGDHGGGIEPTVVQLHEGRIWMLIRTYRGRFTEAFSKDEGLTWADIGPSNIEASGSPGQLHRLHSGRLVLVWNRFIDKKKRTGRREQLSMAFSQDDGRTWTEPVVVAYDPLQPGDKEPQHRLSYPYVYEHVPGELWVTTGQGPLRIRVQEDDFLPRRPSETTYRARYTPSADIRLDGRPDEPVWSRANAAREFIFPWKNRPAPVTEFRALCDAEFLYFTFRAEDPDPVVLDEFRDEKDAVLEDRVEVYLGRDDHMKDYYCLEIDPRGRVLDYRGGYYRRLDFSFRFAGLKAAGAPVGQGYAVEGRIPLADLEALGFPRLRPGVKIRCGMYRAEFSHDRSGRPVAQRKSIHNLGRRFDGPPPVENWISWIDPRTEEPDFHVPTSMGWLEIVE